MIKDLCLYLYKACKKELNDGYNEGRLINHQAHFENLMTHAQEHVPYYQDIFKSLGLPQAASWSEDDLERLPILTKDKLRNEYDKLLSDEHTSRGHYVNRSGGSTGEPTRFVQDQHYRRYGRYRTKYYHKNFLNLDLDKVNKLYLWGSQWDIMKVKKTYKQRFYHWFHRNAYLDCFKMSENDMERYVEFINHYRPQYIRAYAGALYQLALFIERRGLSVYQPQAAITSAEILRDEMRPVIERSFGCKVYNFYGSREVGGIAGECRVGNMHIFNFWNHVELLDAQDKVIREEGKEGRVIVTNLHNYSMPFIRFDIGDMAIFGPRQCPCGNPLPTFKKVTGRVTNYFRKADGTLINAAFFIHFLGVVCNEGHIKKFQVLQEDYDRIKILFVPLLPGRDFDKQSINEKIRLAMGSECQIQWEQVADIPKTEQGKYIYTRCLMDAKN